MKKIVLFFALVVCIYANGQEAVDQFEITPVGINGYVVKDFEGKTAEELYTAVKKWAEYNITNAEQSKQSDIENEFLSYKIFNEEALGSKTGSMTIRWSLL